MTTLERSALFRLAAAVSIAQFTRPEASRMPVPTTDKAFRTALLRTHMFHIPADAADRCDGCSVAIPAGGLAHYRVVDGALFHSAACAALYATAPLDTTRRLA